MKTTIDYLHIPLKSRLEFTQNEMKTSPALVTTQISISASILVSFEPHFARKIPSKTEFREPLNRDNVNDMIVDSTKLIMLPFLSLYHPKWTRHPSSAKIDLASVFPQTPFPEARKLTNKTPAAIASSKPLPVIRRPLVGHPAVKVLSSKLVGS